MSQRDAEIRARLAAGDEDSVITFLLFGVTFTSQPRYSFATAAAGRAADAVAADPAVQRRITDMVAGIVAPGANERLQFARRVIERHGIDVTTAAGKQAAEQVLRDALTRMLADYDTYFRDSSPGATLFRNRGLSSDTSIYAAFAIDAALKDVAAMGVLRAGSVRRVAVIGPGLDFTDKQEGYDFYPLQTIQPFAVIDSLRARNLAAARDFQMTTFDLNPRVNDHIDAAKRRAQGGAAYTVQLPRDATQRWQRELLSYWTRVGDRIGESVPPTAPPPAAGRVDVRAVRIRPDVVETITARDLDIILQRPDPLPEASASIRHCHQYPDLLRRVRAVARPRQYRADASLRGGTPDEQSALRAARDSGPSNRRDESYLYGSGIRLDRVVSARVRLDLHGVSS